MKPEGVFLSAALVCGSVPAMAEGDPAQTAYSAGRFEDARALWQPRAEHGDTEAAFGMGLLYDLGQGVASDASAAYRWYRRAAEHGKPEAELNVAVMADSGRGIAHDAREAAAWYGRAAAHGLPRAEYDLAQLYEAGEGVPRNREAAIAWYQAAASTLPAAAARLTALRAHPSPENQAAPLIAPAPVAPAPGEAGFPAELVWSAPRQSVAVRYFVTILALGSTVPIPVFAAYADRSAILVPPGIATRPYAWRVYAVGPGHYAASPWSRSGS